MKIVMDILILCSLIYLWRTSSRFHALIGHNKHIVLESHKTPAPKGKIFPDNSVSIPIYMTRTFQCACGEIWWNNKELETTKEYRERMADYILNEPPSAS